jgi:hypothetical protein
MRIGFAQDIKPQGNNSIPALKIDTLSVKKKDSLFNSKKDSTLLKNRDSIPLDSMQPKETIAGIITHVAEGYTIQNAKDKIVTLYNEAQIVYTDIDLKAGEIIINYKKKHHFC